MESWFAPRPGASWCNNIVEAFAEACHTDNETEAKSIAEMDPEFHNKEGEDYYTGLMWAEVHGCHSISRLLLSRAGLDTSFRNSDDMTALHFACSPGFKSDCDRTGRAQLDIVISLAKLSSWETINRVNIWEDTALDDAVRMNQTSAALYLSWLGAECKEDNRKYTEVTLQTWIDEGCRHEAQFWAVAANDIYALKRLVDEENVELDRPKLRTLAKLFDHWKVWCHVTSLKSLAWNRIKQTVPAVLNLSPEDLMEGRVEEEKVGILVKMRNEEPDPEY